MYKAATALFNVFLIFLGLNDRMFSVPWYCLLGPMQLPQRDTMSDEATKMTQTVTAFY